MGDSDLLQSQRNDVLLTVRESGINPLEFQLLEEAHLYPKLVHTPSVFFYQFGTSHVVFSPGAETQQQEVDKLKWVGKLELLSIWLTYLQREINAPDLWASLAQERELLGAEPAGAVNTPFTADEQVHIKRTIEEIRVYITSTYSLAGEPLAKVNRKLDYLIDAATRLGRIDWKNIFVGALVSLILQQVIPSGSGFQELIGVAGHLLRHVLGGVMSLPLIH
jgi:hypothetical protein